MAQIVQYITALCRVVKDKTVDYWYAESHPQPTRLLPADKFVDQYKIFFSQPTHIIDNVYLGSAFNSACYRMLKEIGINIIINVTREIQNYFPDDFTYKKYDLYDDNKEDVSPYLEDSYDFITENADKKIFVHCFMGASRSASIVIYYLMKKHNMTIENAIAFLRDKRKIVNLTIKFRDNLNESMIMPQETTEMTDSIMIPEGCEDGEEIYESKEKDIELTRI